MYKVIIIDDEKSVHDAVKLLGNWEMHSIDVVLGANNGESALKIIEDEMPNIAIVDMNMPKMNGTDFLKQLRSRYPQIVPIILSGYNLFDYAKQAIISNAVDYLLKPVDPDELNIALAKAVAQLERISEKRKENAIIENTLKPLLQEKAYNQIIGKFSDEGNLIGNQIEATIPFNSPYYFVIFRFCNIKNALTEFDSDFDLLHYAFRNVITELCEPNGNIYYFVSQSSMREVGLCLFQKESGLHQQEIQQLFKSIITAFNNFFHVIVYVRISGLYHGVNELRNAYQLTKSYLDSANLFSIIQKPCSFDAPAEMSISYSIMESVPLFYSALNTKNAIAFSNIFRASFKQVREASVFSFSQSDQCINQLLNISNALLLSQNVAQSHMLSENTGINYFLRFDYANFEDFYRTCMEIINYTTNQLSQHLSWGKSFDVTLVRSYIDTNCHNDLRVSDIAQEFFVSREYLSRIFAKKYNINIHDYIQFARIEKAKELLEQPGMRIQDVAEILNFHDANYLGKLFRKYYNTMPTEYQRCAALKQSIKDKEIKEENAE